MKYSLLLSATSLAYLTPNYLAQDFIEPLGEIETTVIIATDNETPWLNSPGSTIKVTQNDFTRNGGMNFGDIVKYTPNVSAPFNYTSSDGTFGYGQSGFTGFNIRGVEGNRILMTLDGIRQPEQFISTSFGQNDSSSGGAGRDYYDPAILQTTEILKGSASALYGSDALGGVVAFQTPEAEDFLGFSQKPYGGMLRTQYFSSNNSFATQGFLAYEKGIFNALLALAYREGQETENNGTTPPNPLDQDSVNALLKLKWSFDNSNSIKLTLEHFERNQSINALSAVGFQNIFDEYIHNNDKISRKRYSMDWHYAPQQELSIFDSVHTKFYYQGAYTESQNNSKSIAGRYRDQLIEFDNEIYGFNSTFRKETQHNFFTYGIEASSNRTENRFYREDNGLPPVPNRISFAPSDTQRAAAFFQTEYSPSQESPWTTIVGARLDYHKIKPDLTADYIERINQFNNGANAYAPAETYTNLTLAPRIDVIYEINNSNSIYAKYAKGVRNPTAEETSMIFDHPADGGNPIGSITLPNPDLEEEESHAYEIGYKYLDRGVEFEFASFYTQYSNFIENGVYTGHQNDEGRDILTTVNRGKAKIYGFEISGECDLGEFNSNLYGLSIGAATGKTWGMNQEDHTWLNSVEPWETVMWLGYLSPEQKFGCRMTATYVADVKHVSDTAANPMFRPPSYFTLDLSTSYQFTNALSVQAGINNILDEKYWVWANSRREGGHQNNLTSVDDRSTAPGTNAFVSLNYRF
ncbi:TonB-dependent hemoglobin/transferrin/lactoferrin family receptor [Rubritalea spongiae]|uniref:TonB-dependent hemoglobin/transferrin/lactoferrin family receptor n=1 Tax=Rubritalea spongiae TaxID=430797 RepID=A0ABW5E6S2_9BACT